MSASRSLGQSLATSLADLNPNGVGRSPRRPVSQGALLADASAMTVEVRMPVPPDLTPSLAHQASAGRAGGHLRRVRAGLDRLSVDLGFKHRPLLALPLVLCLENIAARVEGCAK